MSVTSRYFIFIFLCFFFVFLCPRFRFSSFNTLNENGLFNETLFFICICCSSFVSLPVKIFYNTMAKENISVKFLIHLIGERPALWDKTSEEYKDRSLKETSWREICTFVNENYERMTPKAKEEFTRMIMKKWTHIRDSWVKSMKYGYDEKTKKPPKPYIYHNELQFMQKILQYKRRPYDYTAMSYLSNDELYGYRTETQLSNNDLSYCENNGEDSAGKDNSNETNEQIKEEEIHTKTEPSQELENANGKYNNTTDDEDWPLNEVNITPVIELNKASESKSHKANATAKKTRSSIFIKTPPVPQPPPPQPSLSIAQLETTIASPPQAYNAYKYLNDNRHWNFFKGILPSVNSLDEDHTLQFQSGVIALLQQLRESQRNQTTTKAGKMHSLYRGRDRKRKPSADVDYERPPNKTNTNKRRRATRGNTDPIAAEDRQTESEYSTDWN
ncbi:hypothetical protein DOY81_000730 [Sarcophaga bullata]|nr:hypothetical protein DOY81_000730 [Sarcophaga bullata]